MTRHQEMAFALAVSIAVFFVICVSAASAAPATVSGVVTTPGAGAPSAKTAETNVLAMNVDSGAYGDADTANRKGAYSLKLPAGKWALLTSFLEPGKRAASFLSAAIVAKPGQHRAMPPLTLKQFKKPRKRKRHKKRHHKRPAAKVSNVNPRDGRPYDGEAYAVKEFAVVVGGADYAVLGRGMDDIVVTDIVGSSQCKFTVVEWEQRHLIEKEIKLQQSEYFDPATRVEQGHLIDPELFIRGRIEERRGTPPRLAMVAWLEDAKTGAKVSDEVSVVELEGNFFDGAERFTKLIVRDLICARAKGAPSPEVVAGKGGSETPKPTGPKPVANTYTGSISGSADAIGSDQHYDWNGNLVLDAAQDGVPPPPGAPPGEYREFTITSGSFFTSFEEETEEGCVASAGGSNPFMTGFAGGTLSVQLDVPNPAYYLFFQGTGTIPGTGNCFEGTQPFPVFSILAYMDEARISDTTTLTGSQNSLPGFPTYEYSSTWSFSPG